MFKFCRTAPLAAVLVSFIASSAFASENIVRVPENTVEVANLLDYFTPRDNPRSSHHHDEEYRIGGKDRDLFIIENGILKFVSPPDFESPACYLGNICKIRIRWRGYRPNSHRGGFIIRVEDLANISINDVSVDEGNSGTTTATLTVTVSPYAQSSVQFATSDDTANTADNDYDSNSGTVNFTGGDDEEEIQITINGDTDVEDDETLTVTLSNALNAEITDNTGVVTITNDDSGGSGGIEPLNDTGIVWGADYPNGSNETCSGETPSAQDCNWGRDVTENDDSDGHAGFSFTRLNANGTEYSGSGDFNSEPWACVQDNVTGLVWEVKTDDGGIHDKDWTYTSYDSSYVDGDSSDNLTDGGTDGIWGGPEDTGLNSGSDNCADTDSICTTERYVSNVNDEELCGFTDWRLPEIAELVSILALYKDSFPFIDLSEFPNVNTSGDLRSSSYWTSTPYAIQNYSAWTLNYDFPLRYPEVRLDTNFVRLVRGGSVASNL